MFNIPNAVREGEKRITPYVRKTSLDYSVALSRATDSLIIVVSRTEPSPLLVLL